FSSRRRHTSFSRDWSSDVCSSDLPFSVVPIDSKAVPARALRASVFLTTRMYTPDARALLRSSVIWVTVRPRYSAATTDMAFAAKIGRAACRKTVQFMQLIVTYERL